MKSDNHGAMDALRPILVTGSHRSGSTWVGKVIAQCPSVRYIHEPFNIQHGLCVCGAKFEHWFTYVSKEDKNEPIFYEHIKHLLSSASDSLQFPARPLVKDPIAVLSSEWLASTFDMDTIIMIRHPAAFVGSLKRLNWRFGFNHILEQSLLMRKHLFPFEAEIRDHIVRGHDIIDQAVLLWRLIYFVVRKFRDEHNDWMFVRHEDLSRDPLGGFQMLYSKLNLDFSEPIVETIRQYSDSSDPIDVSDPYSVKRNSRDNIWSWKSRLTASEIERIRTKAEDISSAFYSDEDW